MHPQSTRSRQQFVRLCDCGCGQPTLLATHTDRDKGWARGQPLSFLPNHHVRGTRNPRWRGGRYQIGTGYVVVSLPDHPHATVRGTIFEHRLVMEQKLGRYLLPHEVVHHIDGDRANNHPDNLALVTREAHPPLHVSGRWSRDHDRCVDCTTTNRPHMADGRCARCYNRHRYQTDEGYRAHLLAKQRHARANRTDQCLCC